MSHDIIGDIHGYSEPLVQLLEEMGYISRDGVFHHPERKVIFLGDFIDRGRKQREVIEIVRPMIESGSALAVMGNHEFNAIAFATKDDQGNFLREHSKKNCRQHEAFLREYPLGSNEHQDVVEWFKTLPLWLDLEELRIVHACWDTLAMKKLGTNKLEDSLLRSASRKGTDEYRAMETLLKGKEIALPEGHQFFDKDGNPRYEIRVRWWDNRVRTYSGAYIGPESAMTHIPNDKIAGGNLLEYSASAPPVFIGHYWLEGEPQPLAKNIACLDYSVAKRGGKLVAYRWDGEKRIRPEKFTYVKNLG